MQVMETDHTFTCCTSLLFTCQKILTGQSCQLLSGMTFLHFFVEVMVKCYQR